MPPTSLRITEIFYSLQGEANTVGWPTVFVRLTGCPLRCGYCDSEYAFYGGSRKTVTQIIEEIGNYRARYVCVTGGEPLAQPECMSLLSALCDTGYQVSLETSGAIDIAGVDSRVSIVMDIKTPGSGEMEKNLYGNINKLKQIDQIKFVLCDRRDYEWATFKMAEWDLLNRVSDVLFSPSYHQLEAAELASWILHDRINVRFQLQMHKQLWGETPGV